VPLSVLWHYHLPGCPPKRVVFRARAETPLVTDARSPLGRSGAVWRSVALFQNLLYLRLPSASVAGGPRRTRRRPLTAAASRLPCRGSPGGIPAPGLVMRRHPCRRFCSQGSHSKAWRHRAGIIGETTSLSSAFALSKFTTEMLRIGRHPAEEVTGIHCRQLKKATGQAVASVKASFHPPRADDGFYSSKSLTHLIAFLRN